MQSLAIVGRAQYERGDSYVELGGLVTPLCTAIRCEDVEQTISDSMALD